MMIILISRALFERKPMISQNLMIKIHCSECRLYLGLIRKLIKITVNNFDVDEATEHRTKYDKSIFTHKRREVSIISKKPSVNVNVRYMPPKRFVTSRMNCLPKLNGMCLKKRPLWSKTVA